MVNSWRQTLTLDDWMREMEKRMAHEERRPIPLPAYEVVGPGFRPYANEVTDWNSDGPIVGGHFVSIADQVINSPDDTKNWMGIVQSTSIGQGLQRVWEYIDTADAPSPDPALYTRAFVTNEDGTRTYTLWIQGSGGSGGGGTPSGPAGGDLTGTYPSPQIASGVIVHGDVNAANIDGAVNVPSMRTLGNGAQQAVAGNDTRLSDARPPSGPATGDLAGTYPNPAIAPNAVTSAKIADGTIVSGDLSPALQATLAKRFAADLAALVAGTELLVTHNLGTLDVHASFRINASGAEVELYWRAASTNQIGVTAGVAFAANAVRCVVIA